MKHAETGVAFFYMVFYSKCSGIVKYWPYPIGLILWMGQCHMIVNTVNIMINRIQRTDILEGHPYESNINFRPIRNVVMKMIQLVHPVSSLSFLNIYYKVCIYQINHVFVISRCF